MGVSRVWPLMMRDRVARDAARNWSSSFALLDITSKSKLTKFLFHNISVISMEVQNLLNILV